MNSIFQPFKFYALQKSFVDSKIPIHYYNNEWEDLMVFFKYDFDDVGFILDFSNEKMIEKTITF